MNHLSQKLWGAGLILFGIGLLVSCAEKSSSERLVQNTAVSQVKPEKDSLTIPNTTMLKSALVYDKSQSLWTLNDEVYSGYAVVYYPDSTMKEKSGIFEGRKQHQAEHWFADGHYKRVEHYHRGKLHGEKKNWSSDSSHTLLAHLHYAAGKPHGRQMKWYDTGEPYKIMLLNMGREEGLQQAYRKNGDLYANYEAREGRIYGMKKAKLCYGLKEETLPTRKE